MNHDEMHARAEEVARQMREGNGVGGHVHAEVVETFRPFADAVKADADKERMDLFSSIWLFGVGQVLTYGAKKYAAHNWRKGLARSRLLAACLRHVVAYLGGEDCDPETGFSHLDHASCCLMFARELHETRPDTDDRYKGND